MLPKTGNSVGCVHHEVVCCVYCSGKGEVYADKERAIEAMRAYYPSKGSFRQAREYMRDWKKSNYIPCPDCEGLGRWEEEY